MDGSLVLRKLDTLRRHPSRIADRLREPRPLLIGGSLSNRLGLQVLRAVKEEVAWNLRRVSVGAHIAEAFEAIDRDGIVVIPDFLPQVDFRRVTEEYQRSRSEAARGEIVFGPNLMSEQFNATHFPHRYPETVRLLRDNDFLLDLASAVSRRPRTYKPHVTFFTVYKPNPSEKCVDFDANQFMHPDRHFPFIKAFFYLSDVGYEDGPFSYARGSHKLTWERLRFEYEHSVRWAEQARRGASYGDHTKEQHRFDESLSACVEKCMRNLGTICEPIVGRANTLIVSDNRGFHRRGALRSERARSVVYIDFKYLESPARWMFPILKRLYPEGAA
jgi:hypothetical protein